MYALEDLLKRAIIIRHEYFNPVIRVPFRTSRNHEKLRPCQSPALVWAFFPNSAAALAVLCRLPVPYLKIPFELGIDLICSILTGC